MSNRVNSLRISRVNSQVRLVSESEVQGVQIPASANLLSQSPATNTIISTDAKRYHIYPKDKFVHRIYEDLTQAFLTNLQGTEKSSLDNGHVKIKFPNNNTYTGQVNCRQMEGDGEYRWAFGETYKGRLEQNSIQGKGRIEWNDHSWYNGEFHKGHRHGHGNLVSHEYKRFYIGQWYIGRKHGKGYSRYNESDIDFYEGEWNNNQKHGTGYRHWANGTRYIGQWKEDRRHGRGTMIWSNGDVYRGEWENGMMNGYGEYIWNGFLSKSLSWPRENCYMGEWLNGKRHGKGVLKLNSIGGAKYSGNWYMDEKHGYGIIIGNSGAVTKADPLFSNNILTPLESNETYVVKLDSKPSNDVELNKCEKDYSDTAVDETSRVEHGEPRKTTLPRPLHLVSLSYYVRRLLNLGQTQESSVHTIIPTGKCHVCVNESACSCLRNFQSVGKSTETLEVSSESNSGGSHSAGTSPSVEWKCVENSGNERERTREEYEKHWVYNCLLRHMLKLRNIYEQYAKLYCSEKTKSYRHFSMGKIALWQLMRDCGIHKKGISLVQFERMIAFNKATFIEAPYYPFERIEIWQFIHALLEVSWHLYTKLGDIETEAVRGNLAGGLYRLIVNDIIPNAGKHIGNIWSTHRDLLPIYSVYQLYCNVGEPHSAKTFLRATCIVKGISDPEPLSRVKVDTEIPVHLVDGINAITIGEKVTYISAPQTSDSSSFRTVSMDHLASELLALRHIGAAKMISVMAKICPSIMDQESGMIINMDYELTFLEFYEILLEAAQVLIYTQKLSAQEIGDKVNAVANAQSETRFQSFYSMQSEHQSIRTFKTARKLT